MRNIKGLSLTALAVGVLVSALGGCPVIGETPLLGTTPTDLITSQDTSALTIEVDAVDGARPSTNVDQRILDALSDLGIVGAFDKPGGVRFVDDDVALEAIGDQDTVHTFAELRGLQDAQISLDVGEDSARIHLLWVTGRYEDDDGGSLVLGFAYGGDRIVMMADNIQRACENTLLPVVNERLCERTTSTVLLHELGHLFGLVNNGAPMQTDHQDVERGAHDVNEDCIMYFAAETSSVADVLAERFGAGNESEIAFDDACLDDLRAVVDTAGGG